MSWISGPSSPWLGTFEGWPTLGGPRRSLFPAFPVDHPLFPPPKFQTLLIPTPAVPQQPTPSCGQHTVTGPKCFFSRRGYNSPPGSELDTLMGACVWL